MVYIVILLRGRHICTATNCTSTRPTSHR